MHNWSDYSCKEFSLLLEHIEKHDMVVSIHTIDLIQMEQMAKKHPNVNFVFAHPGEKEMIFSRNAKILLDI